VSAPYQFPEPAIDGTAAMLPLPVDTAGRGGVDAAFEQLYVAAFPKVYAFIRCQVSSMETAQDLVSRVFLKAYKHRLKTPPAGIGRTQWIFRIAHTTLIDYWRVEKKRESISVPLDELEVATDCANPEESYEKKERLSQLLRLMNDLADDDRTILVLKFAAQRTNREIAVILNVSEAAVSMRLLRALRRLRDQLQAKACR
jgi:RNA polymerase sigma-70 factor (ECF subfamily)